MTLSDLIERVRAAEGPDRELDLAINMTLLPSNYSAAARQAMSVGFPVHWLNEEELPRYTASLDAVVALMEAKLPDYLWNVWRDDNRITFSAWVYQAEPGMGDIGATAPLALLLAFLTALASQEPRHE